jgi:hypothetical protein
LGLLQGWQDIGAIGILSLLCFIWAGQTLLIVCWLTCTFISLISSGSGRTSNEFQPSSKPCSLAAIYESQIHSSYKIKMNKLLFVIFSTISLTTFAQELLIFDALKIDANTKLIGRYPQYDNQKIYKSLNFIIEDSVKIKKAITALALGNEVANAIQDPNFSIGVVQDFNEVKYWIVNPNLKNIMSNGHSYQFDINKIKELAILYPFEYKFDKIAFTSKIEYEKYLDIQKRDTTFLFSYSPQFKYEGSFEIQFPNNNKFSSPKSINDYLKPYIEKIVPKNDYEIMYFLSKKNLKDQNQFTMTISGSKKLFNELQLDKLKNENWNNTVEQGWFFYRVK